MKTLRVSTCVCVCACIYMYVVYSHDNSCSHAGRLGHGWLGGRREQGEWKQPALETGKAARGLCSSVLPPETPLENCLSKQAGQFEWAVRVGTVAGFESLIYRAIQFSSRNWPLYLCDLGYWLHLSEPQFPHTQNVYLIRFLRRFNEVIVIKCVFIKGLVQAYSES